MTNLRPLTGNFYYGARYYDPKISVWLSVDPMSDQRPSLTPYNFLSNNPIMRTDPTGMLDGGPGDPCNEITTDYVPAWEATITAEKKKMPAMMTGRENMLLNNINEKGGKSNLLLAGIGTAALVGESASGSVLKSRSGYSSGNLFNSSYVFSKSTGRNVNWGSKGIGWGLTIWSFADTEIQFSKGNIDKGRRGLNHMNTTVSALFPMLAIPITIGDYYGQTHAAEINNSITQPGGSLHEGMKTLLNLVGLPASAEEAKVKR